MVVDEETVVEAEKYVVFASVLVTFVAVVFC